MRKHVMIPIKLNMFKGKINIINKYRYIFLSTIFCRVYLYVVSDFTRQPFHYSYLTCLRVRLIYILIVRVFFFMHETHL